jgi:hypothetical protein
MSTATARLIIQVRDRESLDLLITKDDLAVVTAAVRALQVRLGVTPKLSGLWAIDKPPPWPGADESGA